MCHQTFHTAKKECEGSGLTRIPHQLEGKLLNRSILADSHTSLGVQEVGELRPRRTDNSWGQPRRSNRLKESSDEGTAADSERPLLPDVPKLSKQDRKNGNSDPETVKVALGKWGNGKGREEMGTLLISLVEPVSWG